MLSRGVNFDPNWNNGLYDISKDDAEYYLKTFPKQFEMIAKKEEEKKEEVKKPRARKPRKKSTDIIEE